jgi:multiple sugar transport system permease protein
LIFVATLNGSWIRAFLVAAVFALFLIPLWLMVSGSFREPGLPPPRGVEWLPGAPTWEGYRAAFSLVPLGRALWSSVVVSAVAVPLSVVTASWAGLALALLTGARRRLIAVVAVVVLMVPASALWIPRFALFKSLGLVGTWAPLVAPALLGGSPLLVLLYAVAFRRLSTELFDAAVLEGARPVRIWWRVAMPQVKATTTAVALLAFVMFWSNFVDPLLYLNSERDFTAPLLLHSLELLGPTNWPVLLAGAVVVTLPVAIAFVLAQRYFLSEEKGTGWLGH